MNNLIKQNINFIKKSSINNLSVKTDKQIIWKIISFLNKDRLVILSWMKNIWKTNIINHIFNHSNSFYFNKDLDLNNLIKSKEELESLFIEYLKLYKKPEIIVLDNTNKIDWIKNLIIDLYKKWYKLLIVWNSIKIPWKKEIEILSKNIADLNSGNYLKYIIKYWKLNIIDSLEDNKNKENILNLMKSDIFLNSIFNNFSVKNINLYNHTLTFLAQNNKYFSLRELQKRIDSELSISLKTTIDYIDFSLQAKIIKRVYKYDLKTNKSISSKAKYYFNDNWIRNSLVNFNLNSYDLKENLLFNELESMWYSIYWWKNWVFEFSFIVEIEDNKTYIHLSNANINDDVKSEVRKLNKTWDDYKKYLIVKDIKELNLKKLIYDNVEIIEYEEFLNKKIKQL